MESSFESSPEDEPFRSASVEPERYEPIIFDEPFTTPSLGADGSPAMYCRGCDYLLIGSRDFRCPECGRAFNPRNYATFFTLPRKQRNIRKAKKAARKFAEPLAVAFIGMIIAGAGLMAVSVGMDFSDYTPYVIELWLFHAGIAMALSYLVIFSGYRRVAWKPWEIVAFVLPFGTLARCIALGHSRHGTGEVIAAVVISIAIPIAALFRVRIGYRMNQSVLAMLLLAALCAMAVGAYVLFSPIVD